MSASKRKREEPKAPVSQSKQAYVEDEDMSTVVYRQGLEGCDQLILSAYSEISKPDVEQVARELSQAPDEETKNQAKRRINEDEEIRKEFINRILKKWEEKLNKPPSKDEVEERRTYCLGYYGAMVEDVFSHAEKMAAENKGQHHRGQAMRDEINRILKALGNGASHYDLLEVPRTATTKEIESAYKRKAPKIHSDKNDDEEATKCFQALENAKSVLRSDRRRRAYDLTLPKSDQDSSPGGSFDFGEEFWDDAYGREDSQSDEDDDPVPPPPPPYEEAANAHHKMTRLMENFFNLDKTGISQRSVHVIDKVNEKINKHNQKLELAPELYQIDKDILAVLRTDQEKLLKKAQSDNPDTKELEKETKQLQSSFLKTCKLGIHQWPDIWVPLLVDPLIAKMRDAGVTITLSETPSDKGPKGNNIPLPKPDPSREKGKGPEGVPVEDDDHEPQTQRLTQDMILGYAPQTRYFRFAKQEVITGFKFFLKVNEDNPLLLATGADLGHPTCMAYHDLPENQKNDVRNSLEKYNRDTPSEWFKRIKGVAYDPQRRHTYVWVEMADEREGDKAHIMTRSALRVWLSQRYADKRIEDFFIERGGVPPWAREDEMSMQPDHLRLQYPLPGAAGPGYHLLSGYSRMNRRTAEQPGPNAMEELTKQLDTKMTKLLEFLVEDRKEQKEQRDMMMRLLPS